jgi:hypothetical protein
MTSFATACRHVLTVTTMPICQSATEPLVLHCNDTADKQSHGLERLSSFGNTHHRIVSLPGWPPSFLFFFVFFFDSSFYNATVQNTCIAYLRHSQQVIGEGGGHATRDKAL